MIEQWPWRAYNNVDHRRKLLAYSQFCILRAHVWNICYACWTVSRWTCSGGGWIIFSNAAPLWRLATLQSARTVHKYVMTYLLTYLLTTSYKYWTRSRIVRVTTALRQTIISHSKLRSDNYICKICNVYHYVDNKWASTPQRRNVAYADAPQG